MARPKKKPYIASEDIRTIEQKLKEDPTGSTLTPAEREREILKEEAAYLLSVLAGRSINDRYVKELTRKDKGGRLTPVRIVGTTHIYQVADLLSIRFNRSGGTRETVA